MDKNKLKKLKEIGYHIKKCCGLCRHSHIKKLWGTCEKHDYEHLKHTDALRQLSINVYGTCKDFDFKINPINLHGFRELIED